MSLIKVKGSSITGALAAIDGSALTGISGGKVGQVVTYSNTHGGTCSNTSFIGFTNVNHLYNYIDWIQHIYSNNKEHIQTLVEMAQPIHNKLWVDLF